MKRRGARGSVSGTLSAIVLCVVFVLSGALQEAYGEEPIAIYVVNYPLKYFAESIAGTHAEVKFPAPADEDPAYWTPDLDTVAAYQKADLILLNGAGYAKWTKKVSLPRSRMVNTSASFEDRYIRIEGAVTHSHGAAGEHAHEAAAFTTWIDFELAEKQTAAVYEAMSRLRPDLRDEFQGNYGVLAKELRGIDKSIKEIVSKNPSQPLIGSHPVYDYLSRRYGLNMKSVHWEPDEVPTDAQWTELQALLKDHPAKWMIWEGGPLQASVDKLASAGIQSLVFDPCGNVPDEGDFLTVMKRNVQNLAAAFR